MDDAHQREGIAATVCSWEAGLLIWINGPADCWDRRIARRQYGSDAPIDPLDHAAAAVFSIQRPNSKTAISSSSCLINKLKSNPPCADLSSVIKRWRWTFISSNAFRFPSLTYAPTIRSIASDMCENYKTPRGRHDRTLRRSRVTIKCVILARDVLNTTNILRGHNLAGVGHRLLAHPGVTRLRLGRITPGRLMVG